MSYIRQMVETHPQQAGFAKDPLLEAITAVWSCTEACTACSDACLGEKELMMLRHCIRTCLDCSEVCLTTSRMLTRFTETDRTMLRAQLQACAVACQVCGAECARHAAGMEHCKVCAEACRRCERACQELMRGEGM